MSEHSQPYTLQGLIQQLVQQTVGCAQSSVTAPVSPDYDHQRNRVRLHAQLLKGGQVKHETIGSAGRLTGLEVQTSDGATPESAQLWTLVQPNEASGLKFYCNASAAGLTNAGLESYIDFNEDSGVDYEFELQQHNVWQCRTCVAQRLPMLPITAKHSLTVKRRPAPDVCSPASPNLPHPPAVQLGHVTTLSAPLGATSAALQAVLAVPAGAAHPLNPFRPRGAGGGGVQKAGMNLTAGAGQAEAGDELRGAGSGSSSGSTSLSSASGGQLGGTGTTLLSSPGIRPPALGVSAGDGAGASSDPGAGVGAAGAYTGEGVDRDAPDVAGTASGEGGWGSRSSLVTQRGAATAKPTGQRPKLILRVQPKGGAGRGAGPCGAAAPDRTVHPSRRSPHHHHHHQGERFLGVPSQEGSCSSHPRQAAPPQPPPTPAAADAARTHAPPSIPPPTSRSGGVGSAAHPQTSDPQRDGRDSSSATPASLVGRSGPGGRGRPPSCIPKLQMEVTLPEEGVWAGGAGVAGEGGWIAPQDVAWSWRQLWGRSLVTNLSWRHGRRAKGGRRGVAQGEVEGEHAGHGEAGEVGRGKSPPHAVTPPPTLPQAWPRHGAPSVEGGTPGTSSTGSSAGGSSSSDSSQSLLDGGSSSRGGTASRHTVAEGSPTPPSTSPNHPLVGGTSSARCGEGQPLQGEWGGESGAVQQGLYCHPAEDGAPHHTCAPAPTPTTPLLHGEVKWRLRGRVTATATGCLDVGLLRMLGNRSQRNIVPAGESAEAVRMAGTGAAKLGDDGSRGAWAERFPRYSHVRQALQEAGVKLEYRLRGGGSSAGGGGGGTEGGGGQEEGAGGSIASRESSERGVGEGVGGTTRELLSLSTKLTPREGLMHTLMWRHGRKPEPGGLDEGQQLWWDLSLTLGSAWPPARPATLAFETHLPLE